MISSYDWSGGTEAMLRFGPDTGPVVIAALPLFEEANRTRAFMVSVLRALAGRGVGGVLPDLPGQGESLIPTARLSLSDAADAYAACAAAMATPGRNLYGVAIRSGALIDDIAPLAGRWHLSPQDGPSLQHELKRMWLAAGHAKAGPSWFYYDAADARGLVEIGGNLIRADLIAALEDQPEATIGTPGLRIARLAEDPRAADVRLAGSPLWRRAEPGNDPALVGSVANEIAQWIAACEG